MLADDLHPEGRRLDAVGKPRRLRIEERDDVDVAGIVQLAGAVLPHAEDEEAPRFLAAEPAACARGVGKREAERRPERRVGERW